MTLKSKAATIIKFKEELNSLECFLFKCSQPFPEEAKALKSLYEIWNDARVGNRIPAWKDFKFEDFKGWHSNIRVMDVGKDINDIKHNILMGEKFARYWGKKTIYEQIQEENPPSQDTIDKYYQYLGYIYQHYYSINNGSIPKKDGSIAPALWIELPLADDGEHVTHILSAIVPA